MFNKLIPFSSANFLASGDALTLESLKSVLFDESSKTSSSSGATLATGVSVFFLLMSVSSSISLDLISVSYTHLTLPTICSV